jgi:flagellar biosynthesis protein FlhB
MSEESSEEKTEPPSQQHLRKAREEGRVARSPDVAKTVIFFALGIYFLFQFGSIFAQLADLATAVYTDKKSTSMGHSRAIGFALEAFRVLMLAVLPMLLATFIASICADLIQVGPLLAWKAVKIDFNRCNPATGFKKLFSLQTFTSLGLMAAKAILISAVLITVIRSYAPALIGLPLGDLNAALGAALQVIAGFYLWSLLASTFIAVGDYFLKLHTWTKEMYMTKSEVKREHQESFGNPLVKKELKRLQGEADDSGRMFKNIRFCQVIVIDAEKRALGIYFNARFNPEPLAIVVASGTVAISILEEAAHQKKKVVQDDDFVATVFGTVTAGSPIPPEHREAALQLINSR